jgi:uncharacterized protein YbjT (DUF2867 family)
MRNKSPNASDTLISCTISLVVITQPSTYSPPPSHIAVLTSPHRNFTLDDVHVKGAERIARVTASVGVPRLVHVSHLNASPTSTSLFYRSKAAGENAVRDVFPAATIVRPGPMFGHEDKFLTNMPSLSPFLFLIFFP